jgi:DnaJ-class molecular chaperone
MKILVQTDETCPSCKGTGTILGEEVSIPQDQQPNVSINLRLNFMKNFVQCIHCKGTGKKLIWMEFSEAMRLFSSAVADHRSESKKK